MIGSVNLGLGSVPTAGANDDDGSGGAVTLIAPWFSNVAAFMQSQIATLLAPTLASECESTDIELELSSTAGTGAAGVLTTLPGGIVFSRSGATANSFRIIRNRGGATAPVISNIRTQKWALATRVKIVQTQANFDMQLCSISDLATFGTYLGAISSVSGVNYVIKIGSAAGVATSEPLTTDWNTLILIADGALVRAYLADADGSGAVQIGTAQAQTTAPNAAGAWVFFHQNLASAANVEAYCDAVLVMTERAT